MVKRGEPQLRDGVTTGLNGRPASPPIRRIRIARAASHTGIGAAPAAATGLSKPLGHGTVPTFFWGGEATTAAHQGIGERLNQMGVWRDTDRSQ
jgi:hypothetical protein